jgi:COMPASS component SPP1
MKNMRRRIDGFTKTGGKKEQLWEVVKNAEKREGVVQCIADDGCKKENGDTKPIIVKPVKSQVDREVERLHGLLDNVVKLREELKKGMEIVLWREKLLESATDRAEQVGNCGWDQRLCFGDEDWALYGDMALGSYGEQTDKMEVDGGDEPEWWCPGDAHCDRHSGYVGAILHTSYH